MKEPRRAWLLAVDAALSYFVARWVVHALFTQ